ncbi:hypothetical protein ACKWTF_009823 [Chironomus riparius]
MRYIQCIFITVAFSCVSASVFDRKDLPLIVGNVQNKMSVLTNANGLATAQIATNAGILANIQTQLNQVITTNTATKAKNDANNTKLTSLVISLSSFHAAMGATLNANGLAGVGAAYQTLAAAIQAI